MAGFPELVRELQKSFDFYQMEQENNPINRLIVTGGGALTPDLLPALEEALGFKVEPASFDERLQIPEKWRPSFLRALPQFSVALGLGLREVMADED